MAMAPLSGEGVESAFNRSRPLPQYFPTRQYPYRDPSAGALMDMPADLLAEIKPGTVVRFFMGLDEAPSPLQAEDIDRELNDPFARLVLAPGHRPQTLFEVLDILNSAFGTDAVPGQRLYRVADGGQIAWTSETADLDRHLRMVITRHRGEEAQLFISTAPPFTSKEVFLQIFAWDPNSSAYNFYERRRGVWTWAGSSWQALNEPTRGAGPFDSHVNGGPVMKELKAPWLHWHSEASQIRDEMLAPDDPLRNDAFYHGSDLKGGEDLERVVRAGIARWTQSRFARLGSSERLDNAQGLMRHVLTTTTVNIACSPQQSSVLADGDILRLPTTFFLNSDCLIEELRLPVALTRQKAAASFYRNALNEFGVSLKDRGFTLARDVFFAFAVPEPSFEDQVVLQELLGRGALSRRLAIALLAVDFPNPVFSDRREKLMRYVPSVFALDGGGMLEQEFISAVRTSSDAARYDSAEAELLRIWDSQSGNWEADLAERVQNYWKAVEARLSTAEGFEDIFRLAESRRRQFRKRPLSEFGLTLPCATNIALSSPLRMTEQARVEQSWGQP